LPSVNRPTLLSKWISKKRYTSKGNDPNVTEQCGEDFIKHVQKWWTSLQPEWRVMGSRNLPPDSVTHDQWEKLDKYGINGWFSILVCLKWWGTNIQSPLTENKTGEMRDWLDMIEDVRYMMEVLTKTR
ncbi:hypothetical protein F5879DRAFT_809589, partial [Lentinula edodes]